MQDFSPDILLSACEFCTQSCITSVEKKCKKVIFQRKKERLCPTKLSAGSKGMDVSLSYTARKRLPKQAFKSASMPTQSFTFQHWKKTLEKPQQKQTHTTIKKGNSASVYQTWAGIFANDTSDCSKNFNRKAVPRWLFELFSQKSLHSIS